MKDERILKKVDKLLKLYGVVDEEREKFLLDLKDKKYDDQEEIEEVSDNVEEETPTEEVEETEQVEEGLSAEEGEVEEQPAEDVGEEQVEEEVSEVAEEQPQEELPIDEVEQPMEEQPMDQPMEQPQPANEDVNKTIEGLMARIESLEDIVKKLGTPIDEESVGVEPRNPSGESLQESEMDRYNKLRMGR